MSQPINPVTAEQAAKNVQDRLIAEEKARLESNTPYVAHCPYCGSVYPKPDSAKKQFSCRNADCLAVFSVTDIKPPRNLLAEQAKAAADKAASDLKAKQEAEQKAAQQPKAA